MRSLAHRATPIPSRAAMAAPAADFAPLQAMPALRYTASPLQRRVVNGITAGENQAVRDLTQGQVDLHAMGASLQQVPASDPRLQAVEARSLSQGRTALVSDARDRGHELWHLAQQAQGRVRPTASVNGQQLNDEPRLEGEADRLGAVISRASGPVPAGTAARPGQGAAGGVAQAVRAPTVRHKKKRINSSKFRFLRRVQSAYGGSRNVAVLKLVKGSGWSRKVIYLIGRSLGLGVSKLTLGKERVTTGAGTLKKRSHSEAVLRAVLEVAKIKPSGGSAINLSGYKSVYAASTNEACGSDHENCAEESVPQLGAPTYYYANDYGGSDDAGGFEKLNNQHHRDVRNTAGYESDPESEDEAEAYVVDDDDVVGVDFSTSKPASIGVTPLQQFFQAGDKNRRHRHYDEDDEKLGHV